MINLSNTLKHCLAVLLLGVAQLSTAADFAVSPMMIEFDSTPRESEPFSFTIFGRSDANLKLSVFEVSQLETGYMGFVEADRNNTESMGSWISLQTDRLSISDGETVQVNGRIDVPARAAGTYLVGIMVEEDLNEEDLSGIALRVRYAVVMNMRVESSNNRRIKTSFEELAVVEKDDGLYLEGVFRNESSIDNWLLSLVQIRGEDNRLIDRVELKTASAWQRQDTGSRVFPGALVRVYGKLANSVNGEYTVMVRNRFANKSQPVYRDTLRFASSKTAADEPVDVALTQDSDTAPFEVTPEILPIDIRANGASFTTFFVSNNGDDQITVELPAQADSLEAQGVSNFQFYPGSIQVAPNSKTRVVLKQQHIADVDYGNVTYQALVKVPTDDGDAQTLEIKTAQGS